MDLVLTWLCWMVLVECCRPGQNQFYQLKLVLNWFHILQNQWLEFIFDNTLDLKKLNKINLSESVGSDWCWNEQINVSQIQ